MRTHAALLWLACSLCLQAAEVRAVVNAAIYTARIAPGALISIFGTDLNAAEVRINGVLAPQLYSSATQINAQVPYETPAGPALLRIGDAQLALVVDAAAPGIFKLQGERAALAPALAGDFATIYLTGAGEVSPPVATGSRAPLEPLSRVRLPVMVTVGEQLAEVQFAGLAPGYIGLMQLNLRVPALPAGEHPVFVTIGGIASNTASLAVSAVTAVIWDPALQVSPAGSFTHAQRSYPSSTSLALKWNPPPVVTVDHYKIVATDGRSSVETQVTGAARDAILRDLKAATRYDVTLLPCLDAACTRFPGTPTVSATTAPEYWAIQGTGNSYATASHLLPDGNVGSHAFRYGPWAGPDLDGRVQLYYNPAQQDEKGAKIGEPLSGRVNTLEDALAFRGVSGFGLLRVCQPGSTADCSNTRNVAAAVNLYQAVPLQAGGKIRLYFEADGGDGRARILYLDSQDGYLGRDFNAGAATRCSTLADYAPGGGCEPKLAVGVDIDGAAGNASVRNARQFKILYPTRESTAWDLRPGTPMWFTTEWNDGRCSRFGFNAAYAVWDGTRWNVDTQPNGCPKLLAGAQAPAPMHVGGGRYKLYFNQHPTPDGPGDPRVAIKPMRMLYADAATGGDPTVLDFEDWEPLAAARPVQYLWPSGELLNEDQQSRLDDYVILAPTADPDKLVMYSNMSATGTQAFPFIGSAVLVNP